MNSTRRHRSLRSAVAITAAAIVALGGCGGSSDESDSIGDDATEDAADVMEPASATAEGELSIGDGAAPAADEAGRSTGNFDFGSIGRDVIIELSVVMRSDNIEATVASITARATASGGGVASSDVNYGTIDANGESNHDGHAVIVVKVPPESASSLVDGLSSTGTVERINQSAQDVTEQLVNLDVRIENARESVANVRRFMEQTTDLTELVSLEGELTRRQTELEQLEAQERNLSERVALSTVTIEVYNSVPPVSDDDGEVTIGEAFENGWEGFVAVIVGLVIVLATLAPFLVAAAIVGGLAWWWVRRSTRRRNADHAPQTPTTVTAPPPGSGPTAPTGGGDNPVAHEPVGEPERSS